MPWVGFSIALRVRADTWGQERPVLELASRVHEYPTNRVADIALSLSGWGLANLVAAGPFAVF